MKEKELRLKYSAAFQPIFGPFSMESRAVYGGLNRQAHFSPLPAAVHQLFSLVWPKKLVLARRMGRGPYSGFLQLINRINRINRPHQRQLREIPWREVNSKPFVKAAVKAVTKAAVFVVQKSAGSFMQGAGLLALEKLGALDKSDQLKDRLRDFAGKLSERVAQQAAYRELLNGQRTPLTLETANALNQDQQGILRALKDIETLRQELRDDFQRVIELLSWQPRFSDGIITGNPATRHHYLRQATAFRGRDAAIDALQKFLRVDRSFSWHFVLGERAGHKAVVIWCEFGVDLTNLLSPDQGSKVYRHMTMLSTTERATEELRLRRAQGAFNVMSGYLEVDPPDLAAAWALYKELSEMCDTDGATDEFQIERAQGAFNLMTGYMAVDPPDLAAAQALYEELSEICAAEGATDEIRLGCAEGAFNLMTGYIMADLPDPLDIVKFIEIEAELALMVKLIDVASPTENEMQVAGLWFKFHNLLSALIDEADELEGNPIRERRKADDELNQKYQAFSWAVEHAPVPRRLS